MLLRVLLVKQGLFWSSAVVERRSVEFAAAIAVAVAVARFILVLAVSC